MRRLAGECAVRRLTWPRCYHGYRCVTAVLPWLPLCYGADGFPVAAFSDNGVTLNTNDCFQVTEQRYLLVCLVFATVVYVC